MQAKGMPMKIWTQVIVISYNNCSKLLLDHNQIVATRPQPNKLIHYVIYVELTIILYMPLGNQIDSVLKSIFKNSLLVNKVIIFMSNVCNPDIFCA